MVIDIGIDLEKQKVIGIDIGVKKSISSTPTNSTTVTLQVFSQEYINLLLSVYFFVLGILALSHTLR